MPRGCGGAKPEEKNSALIFTGSGVGLKRGVFWEIGSREGSTFGGRDDVSERARERGKLDNPR